MKTIAIDIQEEQYAAFVHFLQTLPYVHIHCDSPDKVVEQFAHLSGAFDFWLAEDENKYQQYITQNNEDW